jgi:hypothetical protein
MKSFLIEIPISLIHAEPDYPDHDDRQIYEHLMYFCSKFFPLPAIDVRLVGERLVVIRGHKYLWAAQQLSYPWLRAVYKSDKPDPQAMLEELPPGIRITPREVLEQENATILARDYHVFFFDAPLTPEEQELFLSNIAGFFERLETPLIPQSEKRLFRWSFPFDGHCGEFEALIPVGDPSWLNAYLETCRKFSREVKRIVSFQGACFSA